MGSTPVLKKLFQNKARLSRVGLAGVGRNIASPTTRPTVTNAALESADESAMRRIAPEGFSIPEFLGDIYTFQGWEVFPGHRTNGKDVVNTLANLRFPERLRGQRVLDIAPWNGFFSFECVRRGAAEVVSLGPDDPDKTGYNKVRDVLGVRNTTYVRASVYDLSPDVHGTFDIVLFLGLIYHLRHPLLALDRVFDVARDLLYVHSPIIDTIVFDKTVTETEKAEILTKGAVMHRLPMVYFTKAGETGDEYNWFMPNRRALLDFVESSGFHVTHISGDSGWAWLSAKKHARSFIGGVEGYNPGAVNFGRNN